MGVSRLNKLCTCTDGNTNTTERFCGGVAKSPSDGEALEVERAVSIAQER